MFQSCGSKVSNVEVGSKIIKGQYVTKFIQLVSPQPVNQFSQISCTKKPQMRAICTYIGYTKATTNDWDIRISVAVKALSANISWMAGQICTIELVLESAHQSISENIWYII